ncbi:GGDEF domain-containing protein [Chitinilyticum litopenaei]|uniref:GGDEF domain-containing protein n=1 Tax=Chitinilyticum litopenaei TaxID=1121276 RepID=UPI00041F042E|nr:GGDEF domain-containing protein [Chitinilyticum litopenaei]
MKWPSLSFASALAALLLGSALLLWWQHAGMNRTLRITPAAGHRIEVIDDRLIGGGSVARHIPMPDKWRFTCELSPQYQWPFCELAVFVGKPEQGLDLAGFDRLAIKARYRGVGSHQMRVFLRNFNPAYASPDRNETWKVMGAFLVPPADGGELELPIKSFAVASWWVAQHKIPPEHASMELDNVPLIQFGSSTLMEPGHHDVEVDYIEFRGKWLSRGELLLLLGLIWLAVIGGVVWRHLRSSREIVDDLLGLATRLEQQRLDMDHAAHYDALTDVRNRTGLLDELLAGHGRCTQMGVVFADIDHFKQINDTYGHDVGDRVLQQFAATLQSGIRSSDYLVRWGGEEFVLFFPQISLDGAELVAEKLRKSLHQAGWPLGMTVTASFGVAVCQGEALDAAICRADAALYRAKRGGRDRVVLDEPQPDGG